MIRPLNPTRGPLGRGRNRFGVVRRNIARAMVGRTVDLLVDTGTIAHGVVTGVMTDAGTPKLVVGGMSYDLNQLLTATPASFGS